MNPVALKTTEELALLYEITKALNESLDLRKSLYKVLDILSTSMDMVRGTVTILNPLRNEISIEVGQDCLLFGIRSSDHREGLFRLWLRTFRFQYGYR